MKEPGRIVWAFFFYFSAMSQNGKRKLVVLGWDAADWMIISGLIEKGWMPALQSVLEKSSYGRLSTMDPPISPMLWTSIATGVSPEKHGILGFAEPDPESGEIRPLLSTSRKVKAFWNMFSQYGLKCNIIGWWPSHPAEPVNGAMVSNFFQLISGKDPDNWPLAEGAVYPKELEEILKEFRVHSEEITPQIVAPFIPDLMQLKQEDMKFPAVLRKEIAHASSLHAATTWLMQHTEWDVTAVYFEMIDHLSHLTMRYREPRLPGVPEDKFELYKQVVDGAYRFQDMMLERILELITEDTALLILSDHGFESGANRPLSIPKEPSGPTYEHSPYGIYCFSGPGIAKNKQIFGASVLDITPTILNYFGLPVGKDMEGKVLHESFDPPLETKWIDSWENHHTGTDPGQHSEEQRINAWSAHEAMEQLIELGYVERPEGTKEQILINTKAEVDYYLARSMMFLNRHERAEPVLRSVLEKLPGIARYRSAFAQCLLNLKKWNEAEENISALFGEDEKVNMHAWFLLGKLYAAQYRGRKALQCFGKALESAPESGEIQLQMANTYLSLSRYDQAEDMYRKIIARDSRNANAHYGLGMSLLKSGRAEEAIDAFLDASELRHFFPQLHYQLGEALRICGDFTTAEMAYLKALEQSGEMLKARMRLAELYKKELRQEEKARVHDEIISRHNPAVIKVVSGAPGSGVEEVLELLALSGMDCIDLSEKENSGEKKAFADIDQIEKQSEKIFFLQPAQLFSLPQHRKVKLSWIDRDHKELLLAQLHLSGKHKALESKAYPTLLGELNVEQAKIINDWLMERAGMQVLKIRWNRDESEEIPETLRSFYYPDAV